jgi:hypothetical protein
MRIADPLEFSEAVRVPGHRFIRRLVCPACGHAKQLFHLAGSLDASVNQCDTRHTDMKATGFDIVESLDGNLPDEIRSRTLHEVGLRCGDVIEAG